MQANCLNIRYLVTAIRGNYKFNYPLNTAKWNQSSYKKLHYVASYNRIKHCVNVRGTVLGQIQLKSLRGNALNYILLVRSESTSAGNYHSKIDLTSLSHEDLTHTEIPVDSNTTTIRFSEELSPIVDNTSFSEELSSIANTTSFSHFSEELSPNSTNTTFSEELSPNITFSNTTFSEELPPNITFSNTIFSEELPLNPSNTTAFSGELNTISSTTFSEGLPPNTTNTTKFSEGLSPNTTNTTKFSEGLSPNTIDTTTFSEKLSLNANSINDSSSVSLPNIEAHSSAPSQESIEILNTAVTSNAVPESPVITAIDSIPEPPTVPSSVEEFFSTPNPLIDGEPTFESLGLGGWSPSGIVQQCLEFVHVTCGLPWWASILTGTVIVRLLLFPLVVQSQRNAARMTNRMPQIQILQLKMTEARQSGNALMAAKYGNDMMLFMRENGINPLKNMMVPLAMAPVFISFFFGLRTMTNLPLESMKTGGMFWFTDLTLADPYFILPLITSITMLITLEVGVDSARLSSTPHGPLLKYVLRGMPVIMFPFTMNFPAAILCYWVSTNVVSLIQVSTLRIPVIRQKLNIEALKTFAKEDIPVTNKGFAATFKDSWTNMKITREMEERERYDDVSFKRAGRGPIPKTYKYDPTKVNKENVIHAKNK